MFHLSLQISGSERSSQLIRPDPQQAVESREEGRREYYIYLILNCHRDLKFLVNILEFVDVNFFSFFLSFPHSRLLMFICTFSRNVFQEKIFI